MKNGMKIFAIVLATAALSACAHKQVDEQVDKKLAHESEIKNNADLRSEIDGMLTNAKGLTDDQKTRLTKLNTETREKMDAYRENSLKLRSLLVKDLVAKDYDDKEVDTIKHRIREVEDQRVALIFSSAKEVNQILGRWGTDQERARFYRVMDYTTPMYYGR